MWCPSVSLSVWANAWLAGSAAPDDVLDALSQWAPRHSVTAYDSVAADRTGLPWPDLDDAGAVSLLQTLRTAAGSASAQPAITVALPVPGDVRGLPAGTQFGRDAIAAGEAIIVGAAGRRDRPGSRFRVRDSSETDGEFDFDLDFEAELCALSWTVYSLPAAPSPEHVDLGDAEYTLRDGGAVGGRCARRAARRAAPGATSPIRAGSSSRCSTPHAHIACPTMRRRGRCGCWRTPHTSTRSSRSAPGLMPIGLQSSSEAQIANEALRPLTAVVRSARLAAVSAILHSAWRS